MFGLLTLVYTHIHILGLQTLQINIQAFFYAQSKVVLEKI